MKIPRPLWLAVAGALLSACTLFYPVPGTGKGCQGESASYYPAPDVVRLRASRDLGCNRSEVRVEQRGESRYRAHGCGASRDYDCEDDAVSGCSLQDASERDSCQLEE